MIMVSIVDSNTQLRVILKLFFFFSFLINKSDAKAIPQKVKVDYGMAYE